MNRADVFAVIPATVFAFVAGIWLGATTIKGSVTEGRVYVESKLIQKQYHGDYMCLKVHKP